MSLDETLQALRGELSAARVGRDFAYSEMLTHQSGENSSDSVVGARLQQLFLLADEVAESLSRQIRETVDLLDTKKYGG